MKANNDDSDLQTSENITGDSETDKRWEAWLARCPGQSPEEIAARIQAEEPELLLYLAFGRPPEFRDTPAPAGRPPIRPEVLELARKLAARRQRE